MPGHGLRQSVTVRQGAYLPHWTLAGFTYAVCFRLANSLPREAMDEWQLERDGLAKLADRPTSPQWADLRDMLSSRVEALLDVGHGECWLRRPEIARILADALRRFDGERYRLAAWCVMPNHVHVVVRPLGDHTLPEILKAWKGFSGRRANQALNLWGEFWQPEYYDHLIRSAGDLAHAIDYVVQNPVKAGLVDWPWVWVDATVGRR